MYRDMWFQNAVLVSSKSAAAVWSRFAESCPYVYSALAGIPTVDRKTSFMVCEFIRAVDHCGVVIEAFTIEEHNYLSVVERYHIPLQRVYSAV